MAYQFLRGDTAKNDAYTGPVGSLSVDLEAKRLRVHDGSTAGGATLENSADLNARDTANRNRANHTGTQPASTISDFEEASLAANTLAGPAIYTVGDGGDFHSVNAAVTAIVKKRPGFMSEGAAPVQLKLLSGFVMTEQVALLYQDLSYVEITSEDDVVYVDTTGMTDAYMASFDNAYMFLVAKGAKSPVFSVQFERSLGSNEVAAFYGAHGGIITMGMKSGGRKFWKGAHLSHKSSISCINTMGEGLNPSPELYACDFSQATRRGLDAYHFCEVNLPQSYFYDCSGDYGVYLIWRSEGNFLRCDAHGCTSGAAFGARDGGSICVRDTNASDSDYGYYFIHNVVADLRSHGGVSFTEETSDFGLNAKGCRIGLHCYGGVVCEAVDLNVRNCTEIGIRATGNSTVRAGFSVANGSALAIQSTNGSRVDFSDAEATSCGAIFYLQSNGVIDASRSTLSSVGTSTGGIIADGQCNVNCMNGTVSSATELLAASQSNLCLDYADVNCDGVRLLRGSSVGLRSAELIVENVSTLHIAWYQGSTGYTSGMTTGGAARRFSSAVNTPTVDGILYS